jgi:hypothetical protein
MKKTYVAIGIGLLLIIICLNIFSTIPIFITITGSISSLLFLFLGNIRSKVDCTKCEFCRYECSNKIIKNE